MPEGQDTQQQPDEDVEAHLARSGRRDDDSPPTDGTEREQAAPDADDDVEGHAARVRF